MGGMTFYWKLGEKYATSKKFSDNFMKKYGQPIDHWMAQLDTVPDLKHGEQVEFLKREFGMGHGHANALVAVWRSKHPTT